MIILEIQIINMHALWFYNRLNSQVNHPTIPFMKCSHQKRVLFFFKTSSWSTDEAPFCCCFFKEGIKSSIHVFHCISRFLSFMPTHVSIQLMVSDSKWKPQYSESMSPRLGFSFVFWRTMLVASICFTHACVEQQSICLLHTEKK